MQAHEKNPFKNLALFFLGILLLVAGIVLILSWWPWVVHLFKGVTGMILALAGLLVLFLIRDV